jgi:hypothetical protein
MKNKDIDIHPHLLYHLTLRTVLFLVLFLSSVLLIYGIGNYQQFLDKTQKFILSIAAAVSIMLIFFSVAGFILAFLMMCRKGCVRRGKYIAASVLMLLSVIYGTVLMVVTRAVSVLSAGV